MKQLLLFLDPSGPELDAELLIEAFLHLDGVVAVEVDAEHGCIRLAYDPRATSAAVLLPQVAGFGLAVPHPYAGLPNSSVSAAA